MRIVTPWIDSAAVDGAFILGPAWLITAAVIAMPRIFAAPTPIGDVTWLLLVVCLDVAHVYSTLFRTYFDARERSAHGALLTLVPLSCWVFASVVYALSAAAFWTVFAYAAVFHFVRQQYGLMMLYATAGERADRYQRPLDELMIYAATLYPLIYWHAHLPRAFVWFIEGDFLPLPLAGSAIAGVLYVAIIGAYTAHEIWRYRRGRPLNLPKLLLLLGTAVSWYTGIVALDADLAFTATNVIAHAVPYFALVWIYSSNRERRSRGGIHLFRLRYLPMLALTLLAFAYIEEGLWDGFLWRDHADLFGAFSDLPPLSGGPWLALAVPLLMLPQLTHYVLDAFIWRLRSDPVWRETLLWRRWQSAP